jgi:hypothetical protein
MTTNVRHTLLPDGTYLFEIERADGTRASVPVLREAVDAVELAESRAEHVAHGEHNAARRLAIALRIAEPELLAAAAPADGRR